jgi:phage baseplate assembly protein W
LSYDLKIVSGDLRIKDGALETLTGISKLKQDITKIVTTELGADPFNSWYGSMVSQSLIGNTLPDDITSTIAQSQLQTAIDTIKQLQGLQVASGQKTTPDELIAWVKGISIQRNEQDLRVIQIMIEVLTKAFGTVGVSFNA